ncbi:argininosuccinate lyase [Variovorax sp. KK3]|uniref:argininosuccinate lyase n=1 Tax=Variovorax sp. KK3 TaxID=1855728 RepID=UPI00097C5751|nr:argininosuccinate lyase [Variovorax sp. KK3]
MESKVSRRLKEPLAQQICDHIYGPRLARDFPKQFDHLTDVNQAHLLMLHKTGLVAPDVARQLARGLLQMEAEGPAAVELDPAREDPYFNYEAKLMTIAGRDVGGRLHMARSRNDIAATTDRMRARSLVLDAIDAVGRARRVALERASDHGDVVMPGYTHLQPAQPITFGFYMSAVAEALGRDMDRLQGALPHIDAMPLGAGALAGTRFAIDRDVTARALGFGSASPNTLDAVASRDFAWEAMSAMAIVALTWGRVAQDFHVWSTPEFGLVSFPDRVASTSSIMPQKKNPAVLEYLRGKSSHVIGLLTTSLIAVKGTHFSHGGDSSRESMRSFWECADEMLRCLSLFELVLSTVEPQRPRMLERARFDFSVATDLADGLVAEGGMSFRDAHHVVGGLVRMALDAGRSAAEIDSEMLDRAAVEVVGARVEWPADKLRDYLDPVQSVNARRNGGPAPAELVAAVRTQQQHLENALAGVRATRQALDAARRQMKREVEAMADRSASIH